MQRLLILLDYDGTLTDFSKNPDHSRLSPSARALLKRLRRKHPVIFISGRFLKSLRKVSGLKDFPMVGTHGFEARNLPGGLRMATPALERRFKKEAARLWKEVQILREEFPDIHIEQKPFSSTLHYRGISIPPSQVKKLHRTFNRIFFKTVTRKWWTLQKGKKMIEAMPRGFNKGKAVKKILERFPGYTPLYAGDDLTDISVFKVLGKKGIKIGVGHRIPKRFVDIRLESPKHFLKWLERFVKTGRLPL